MKARERILCQPICQRNNPQLGALFNTDAWISAQGSGGYIDFNEAEAIVIANNQEDTNGPAANGSPCP